MKYTGKKIGIGWALKGKTCVITGATSGIGRAAALQLGGMGADLLLVGRNERKGADLIRRLGRGRTAGSAHFLRADLSVQHEVMELAKEIARRHPSVDVLINNAGACFDSYRTTPDGIESTFATNHLSHFLLTILLLDRLRAAGSGARIITVASGAHAGAGTDFEQSLLAGNFDRKAAYRTSKLANVMFAYELARRLRGTNIASNALDPGSVATNFGRNNGFVRWMRNIVYQSLKRDLVSPRKGAEGIVYLASSPALEGVSGRYFYRTGEAASSPVSHDGEATKRLWELSIRLTGLEDRIGPA